MIELKPTPEATISPGVPKLLQEGFFVRFTDKWPDTMNYVQNQFFQISKTNQVPYDRSYILPTNDYRDVDLSNSSGGEAIYPENTRTLYEVVLGFKPGNYLAEFFIPAGEFVSRLEQAGMVPDVTHATRKYLGTLKPEDSPYDDKRIFLYFVKDLEPMIMRLYVNFGIDFEKCVVGFIINKCYLVVKPNPTPDQIAKSKVLKYYSELRW